MAKKQGRARSMSVDLMMKSFMDLHSQGHSIAQIADEFNISPASVYKNLDKIADANGVTRESLLERNSSPHSTSSDRIMKERTNIENLFNELDETIFKLMQEMKSKVEELQ